MPTWLATMEQCKALRVFVNGYTNAQIGGELERRFSFKVGSIDAIAVQSIKNKWATKLKGNLKNDTGKMRGNPNNWVNSPCAALVAACKSAQSKPVPFGTRKQIIQKLKQKPTPAPAPAPKKLPAHKAVHHHACQRTRVAVHALLLVGHRYHLKPETRRLPKTGLCIDTLLLIIACMGETKKEEKRHVLRSAAAAAPRAVSRAVSAVAASTTATCNSNRLRGLRAAATVLAQQIDSKRTNLGL